MKPGKVSSSTTGAIRSIAITLVRRPPPSPGICCAPEDRDGRCSRAVPEPGQRCGPAMPSSGGASKRGCSDFREGYSWLPVSCRLAGTYVGRHPMEVRAWSPQLHDAPPGHPYDPGRSRLHDLPLGCRGLGSDPNLRRLACGDPATTPDQLEPQPTRPSSGEIAATTGRRSPG